MKNAKNLSLMLLLTPVVMLPGCAPLDWLKKQFGGTSAPVEVGDISQDSKMEPKVARDDTSEVLVTIDGKPVITVNSFEREFDKILQENPQLKQVLPFMPDIKKNFLQGLVNQELIDYWVQANDIDRKIEYKQEMNRMLDQVKRAINTKFFSDAYPVKVTAAEVKEFYEKNKDNLPDFLISHGGVKTIAVSFDKEEAAKAFLAKVQELNDIEKAAVQEKLQDKVRDFKLVHQQSIGIDPALRNKIVDMKKVPEAGMVKGEDGAYWVFRATEREETQYQPFENVKAALEQQVTKDKRMDVLSKELEKLKKKYDVEINETFLKEQEEQAAKAAREAAQKIKKSQAPKKQQAASDEKPAKAAQVA